MRLYDPPVCSICSGEDIFRFLCMPLGEDSSP